MFGNDNLFGNGYKKEIWYACSYERGFGSWATIGRHFEIFDHWLFCKIVVKMFLICYVIFYI